MQLRRSVSMDNGLKASVRNWLFIPATSRLVMETTTNRIGKNNVLSRLR